VDLAADYKVAKTVIDEVPTRFRLAVESCLDGNLHGRDCGLEKEYFCKDVLSTVIALFEE
jgi:hypothetical protein